MMKNRGQRRREDNAENEEGGVWGGCQVYLLKATIETGCTRSVCLGVEGEAEETREREEKNRTE